MSRMTRVVLPLALLLLAGAVHAQPKFLYVNNNIVGANTVSAYSVTGGGALVPIPGSPFPTGGVGEDFGFYASNRITACVVGSVLFVANQGSNTVSSLRVNTATGALTAAPGSPFPVGVSSAQLGLSLAATPDTRFLFVSGGSAQVSAFQVAANGSLTLVPGSPFPLPSPADGSRVTPDGKFLVVATPNISRVAVMSIAANGSLSPVPGSPFPSSGGDAAASVDMDCANHFVFASDASSGATAVDVYARQANGALSPIAGSPFSFASGSNSNVGVLSPDDRFLFVSNQASNTFTVLSVAANGSLSLVPGSPFPNPGANAPHLMATDDAGTFLYAANGSGTVSVFRIAANGALSPVPGSPFGTTPSFLSGVAAFPPKSCVRFCTPANQPPAFVSPTPANGSVLQLLVNQSLSFDVSASDSDSGDVVALSASGVPPGATLTPVLPATGNPVTTQFAWTALGTPAGDYPIVFTAADLCGHSDSSRITVRVTTNRPPDCSAAAVTPTVLWPPNHRYAPISISGVTDPDGDPITVTVIGITQDEPINTRGDGNTCPDGQIVNGQASVRAERTGTPGIPGNGRVYGIIFTASDGKGGSCTDTAYVCVPHDQGDPTCVDDGQRYGSLDACSGGSQLTQEITEVSLAVAQVTATQVTLEFALPQDLPVDMSVFDLAGRRVATVEKGVLTTGVYQRTWDMRSAAQGMYFVRLRAGRVSLTRTVLKVQ